MNDEQTQPANLPPPSAVDYTPWLHWLALAFMALTFVLVCWGGTVTSKGAGLAVPDAPNTYGHNMLTFPVSEWRGGVFWEHTHRLLGFAVGVAGSIMCWVLLAHRRQRTGTSLP